MNRAFFFLQIGRKRGEGTNGVVVFAMAVSTCSGPGKAESLCLSSCLVRGQVSCLTFQNRLEGGFSTAAGERVC